LRASHSTKGAAAADPTRHCGGLSAMLDPTGRRSVARRPRRRHLAVLVRFAVPLISRLLHHIAARHKGERLYRGGTCHSRCRLGTGLVN
jgi:hypothetical protein